MTTTTKQTAYVEVRNQHAKTGSSGRKGPDAYVAVQIVPEGVERLRVLNHAVAAKRGIEIQIIDEGYSLHTGPRSRLGQAIRKAEEIAAKINGEGDQE